MKTSKKHFGVLMVCCFFTFSVMAQKVLKYRIPATGQIISYTNILGEDADNINNPISLTDNGNGTISDNNNLLMWQKVCVGDFTIEQAQEYVRQLNLGGFTDWRLPSGQELLSINHFDHINPAIDTTFFTKTIAEYWWTNERRADDTSKVWAVNAGGGIGAHPKIEALAAGGTKHFWVRAVRNLVSTTFSMPHFTDNVNGTITDNFTGLIWQKGIENKTFTWDSALMMANSFSLAGYSDWRLPTIKELQSLNDPQLVNPSFEKTAFSNLLVGDYWSATTLFNTPSKAWDINNQFGIVTQHDKTTREHVILVRGGIDPNNLHFTEANIPGGTYAMGDHFGFVDPSHPSDELPIHTVTVDSFNMAKTEVSNEQFLAFLNSQLLTGKIEVRNNLVYRKGDTNIYCYTNALGSYYSIAYNGKYFSMKDQRLMHPMVGVNWFGCIAFCNWLSEKWGLDTCYNLVTGICDFTKNGYRLPTEAEWEWAARGGHTNPYFNYCKGNFLDTTMANLSSSGDPYEAGTYPQTTPCGFYNGSNRTKSDYNWPSTRISYQTAIGINDFGLMDMQGNVWELINDWYGQDYYSKSEALNPKGPNVGFIMPDGKPYRGMRGGNWYNGLVVNGISDGHSRVSNRNPSYYRGPQDPNHPYYHIGFRVARKLGKLNTGISDNIINENKPAVIAFPNPFAKTVEIRILNQNNQHADLQIYNQFGELVYKLQYSNDKAQTANFIWDAEGMQNGIYFYIVKTLTGTFCGKIILDK